MNNNIKRYVDDLFKNAPKTRKTYELKEEILANINDKYKDLLDSGLDENLAYAKAVSSIGDIDELLIENDSITEEELRYRKKAKIISSISTMLYILCPIPVLLNSDVIGVVLLLVMVAIATGMNVYNSNTKLKKTYLDDELYAEFIEYKNSTDKVRKLQNGISSIIWSLTLISYFLISFYYDNWEISWIIFIIGGLIQKITRTIFQFKHYK